MRKRLRKKYRLKEFKEYGFQAGFKFKIADDGGREELLCDFITMIEPMGLVCGGGGSEDEWDVFITGKKGSATEEHRSAVTEWLVKEGRVTEYAVGPMIDAWNDPLKDLTAEYKAK